MKIAISGKGGVGKTTLVATLAKVFFNDGQKVITIDADPDANLASALGFPKESEIVPVTEMKELINERTGSSKENYGKFFKLNPTVSDLPDKLAIEHDGIKLISLGAIKRGGGGCACPENVFLKALLSHLILRREEVILIDMEAGIEHLGRGTVEAVDALIVVLEPGMRSVRTFYQVEKLSKDIGIKTIFAVLNKVANARQREVIENELKDVPFLGCISYNDGVAEADLMGKSAFDNNEILISETKDILLNLKERLK
ncbi:MAG: ATP-binding protein [Candidatus Anammoxibacter sp.]